MSPLLPGLAGALDLTMEEGARWQPAFLHLVNDAVDQDGEPEPFPSGTTAYLTIRYQIGSDALVELGPSGLDGTIVVTAAAGLIECDLAPEFTLDLPLPADVLGGRYDLVIYPEGDEAQAYRLLEGRILYRRRVTARPPA